MLKVLTVLQYINNFKNKRILNGKKYRYWNDISRHSNSSPTNTKLNFPHPVSTLLNTDENHHKELKYELPIKISQKKKERAPYLIIWSKKYSNIRPISRVGYRSRRFYNKYKNRLLNYFANSKIKLKRFINNCHYCFILGKNSVTQYFIRVSE